MNEIIKEANKIIAPYFMWKKDDIKDLKIMIGIAIFSILIGLLIFTIK